MQKLPLGKGSAKLIVVKYPSEAGGYTPGDTWDLYVGSDNPIEKFIYHRGGPKKPSLVIATWAGYKKAGPLLISTDHRGTADGKPLRSFLFECGRQAGGVGHLGERAIGKGRPVRSIDVDLHESDLLAITTVVQELPSLGQIAICSQAVPKAAAFPADDWTAVVVRL